VLVVDYLVGGQRIDRLLLRLRGLPAYREVPIVLTFGPPFVREAAAMATIDKKIIATIRKPFTVNQLLQVILPLSLGMPVSSVHLAATREAQVQPDSLAPGFDAINRLPGVRAQFQWSSQGEIIAVSNEEASRLSNALSGCLRLCFELSEECGFGDIWEVQLFSMEANALLFSTPGQEGSDFRTVGVLTGEMTQPDDIIQQIQHLVSS
jgi:hypothetical protein